MTAPILFAPLVELYLGPALGWVDITADVRQDGADSGGGITISRGQANWGQQADPGKVSLVVNNAGGKYSPRNPRSPYYGLLGRNTPVRVGVRDASDQFGRTESAGWGGADSGQAWTPYTYLSLADFDADGGQARIRHSSADAQLRGIKLAPSGPVDSVQIMDVSTSALLTGASLVTGFVARLSDDGHDWYWLRCEFDHDSTDIIVKITRSAGGTWTDLAVLDPVPGLTYSAGTPVTVMASVEGGQLGIKVWPAGDPEPRDWTAEVADPDPAALAGAGGIGIQTWLVSGNTNIGGVYAQVDNYQWIDARIEAEISSWPPRWNTAGTDVWVPVQGAGVLRRYNQGRPPVLSPWQRTITSAKQAGLLAYWTCEDDAGATQAASALPGGASMTASGDVEFAGHEHLGFALRAQGYDPYAQPGTLGDRLMSLAGGGTLFGTAPAGVSSPVEWTVSVVAQCNPGISGPAIVIAEWATPGSDWPRWEISYTTIVDGIEVAGYDTSGGRAVFLSTVTNEVDLTEYRVDAADDGAGTVTMRLWLDGLLEASGTFAFTLGRVDIPRANPAGRVVTNVSGFAFGHLQVWDRADAPGLGYPAVGGINQVVDGYGAIVYSWYRWVAEAATDRLARVAADAGIPIYIPPVDAAAVARMGAQPDATTLDLVAECVNADGGILRESRSRLGLSYRPRQWLYNQAPLVLSYTAGHIMPPVEPVDDDQQTINDVTVKRSGGSTARAVREDGPLSILPPPDGVGAYEASPELNVATDAQLPGQASWHLHLGTVDETRYPRITINLASPAWQADPTLAAKVTAVDSGDVVRIDDLPAWLPPDSGLVMVQGYRETIGQYERVITWNATPASPWTVATADGSLRVAARGATLAAAVNDSALTLSLATPTLWRQGNTVTLPDRFPVDVRVGGTGRWNHLGGEVVTATAIAGTTSPQTITLSARGVNGISRAWPAGTPIQLADVGVAAL